MLALLALLLVAGSQADVARIRVNVNGASAPSGGPILEPLDDVVLRAETGLPARCTWELVEKPAASSVSFANTEPDGCVQSFHFVVKDRDVRGLDTIGLYRVRVTVTAATVESVYDVELRAARVHRGAALPRPDPSGAQLAVASTAAGGCGVGAVAMLVPILGLFGSFCVPVGVLALCPCMMLGASTGACVATNVAISGFEPLLPWRALTLFATLAGVAATIDGALVGFFFFRGGFDTPMPWYFMAAPVIPGLALLAAAPLATVGFAWLSAPDELLAHGALH